MGFHGFQGKTEPVGFYVVPFCYSLTRFVAVAVSVIRHLKITWLLKNL